MCRFWKVLVSDNIISKVSSHLAASFQEYLCHGLSRHIPCCVLKSLTRIHKVKARSPVDSGFAVNTQIPAWWRSLIWWGEILAAAVWADAPVQAEAGAQAKSSIVQGEKQMKGCLWLLMTVVTGAAHPVNSLLFSSLMLLTECATSSWWNRAPGSALWSSFIACFVTCCCIASSPTNVTLPNSISSWPSFILQNSHFYRPGWRTCRNTVNQVYKHSSPYHYLKCCT